MQTRPRLPGSYLLVLELERTTTLHIGRLGCYVMPAGWYIYSGSAMGGLAQRVGRHLRASAVRRWHLDYLRAEAAIREVRLFPGRRKRECDLAQAVLALPQASLAVPGFGASDCRCRGHLAYFPVRPALERLSIPRARFVSPMSGS